MSKFTFLVASARKNGNSEQLAKIAAESLGEEHDQQWLTLHDLPLPAFEDRRHGDDPYTAPTGNASVLLEATVSCDNLVFVSPVYWYSVPAPLKLYLDYWSHWMRVEECRFKEQMSGSKLWVISASAGPAEQAAHMFESLKLCAGYMNMDWGGSLLGNGTAAGDVLNDSEAIENAKSFFGKA